MTLFEMSVQYESSACAIRSRIAELQAAEKLQDDPELAFRLQQRINALIPLLRECRELAVLTSRYYDRSYHKHDRYSL